MIRRLALIAVLAFGLHHIWESYHVVLYGGYENLTSLPITFWATIGDVVYTLGAYFFVALIKRDSNWLIRMTKLDFTTVAFIGFAISLYVEYKALAQEHWFYLDTMPILPGFHVGLSPVLQMTIMLPLTFFLTRFITQHVRWLR